MTHTLQDLESGKLIGVKRLKLACGLKEFPEAILTLAETLEILDLSDNDLTKLPQGIVQLKKLKVIFFANNAFTEFPKILSELPLLNMIGFKANKIKSIPENAFPPLLNWLILTNNKIEKLPKTIGNCTLLQKFALAGNCVKALPIEMANCKNLELFRVSANQLESIPEWLFELPKLSWLAFGGNPATYQMQLNTNLESYNWSDFTITKPLGEGASGFIYKAHWVSKKQDVAIKVFKGAVTSDGLPEDEMEISIAAGVHNNLISVLGKIKEHPEEKNGLIMTLIPPAYTNLGNPPSFKTCTRDVFNENTFFSLDALLKIAKGIASVCEQLHNKGINHGDLYAHNILINPEAESLLGDFGAASFYNVTSKLAHCIERVEVRAFGCLLEDILGLIPQKAIHHELFVMWQKLIANCFNDDVKLRPSFSEILDVLNSELLVS